MSRIVRVDGGAIVGGAVLAAALYAKSVQLFTHLSALEGYTGILWRGGWAAREGGAARLAVLDAGHGDAERRAESAKAELANTARPPQIQPIPGGVDLSGCDVFLEERATALEVEARTLTRVLLRKAIRDAAEFEAILVAFAEATRVYPPYEVVAAMMVADYPSLKVNARHGKATRARARARDNIAAEVRARVAEILANPAAAPAVTGEVRKEIIGLADRLASCSKELITKDGLATIGDLAGIYEGLAKSRKA